MTNDDEQDNGDLTSPHHGDVDHGDLDHGDFDYGDHGDLNHSESVTETMVTSAMFLAYIVYGWLFLLPTDRRTRPF